MLRRLRMGNIIVSLIILTLLAGAAGKIIIEKKKGAKCIGCPYNEQEEETEENCSCS